MSITRRNLIRICSFAIAIGATLAVRNVQLMRQNTINTRALEYSYMRAVEELSTATDNINNTLEKELYAGTADMHEELSAKLWRESSAAKSALSQLPVEELQLENTNKFLSQVGNYALSIAEKIRDGKDITPQEYRNLEKLHDYSKQMCDDMWDLESSISSGEISFAKVKNEISTTGDKTKAPTVTEGFTEFEEGFDSYPTLIYDGPFSDNILEQNPRMTKNASKVTQDKALEKASLALGINSTDLSLSTEEGGKMPSWVFADKDGTVSCAVTKNGGYISYFLKSRQVNKSSISKTDALASAKKFLDNLGINSIKETYYEEIDGSLTVNYAYNDNGICCYTDLIKVSVAMDNGEILGYDARGYIVNHQERKYQDKKISVLDAQKKVSPMLKVLSRELAVIPSNGKNELLCYEFKCEAKNGKHVIVYINAYSGKEEQILILFESESGTLAM